MNLGKLSPLKSASTSWGKWFNKEVKGGEGEGWREENINLKCKTLTFQERKIESTARLTKQNEVVQNTCSSVSSLLSLHWKEFKLALSKAMLQEKFSWELFRPQRDI